MFNNRKAARFVYVAIFFLAGFYYMADGQCRAPSNTKLFTRTPNGMESPLPIYSTKHLEFTRHDSKQSLLSNTPIVKPQGSFDSQNRLSIKPIDSNSNNSRIAHIRSLLPIFEKFRPNIERLTEYKDDKRAPEKAFDQKLPIFTKEELANYLIVPKAAKKNLTKSHFDTVAHLPKYYPKGVFKGQGVVFTSGGKYLPTMVTSLRMLRRVSPVIPVEVFLADNEEYEPEICDKLFPMLGAKCIVLENVYGREFLKSFGIRSFQLKALAIWASSFEDVIFMDADNIAMANVEASLQQEPYLSTGYIIWPDYWFRTTSTHYYDIAGIKLGERVRGSLNVTDPTEVPQADLRNALPGKSSESGQLMISKYKHYRSLLLAVYYNLNGYTAYYQLFSQGTVGEGDKETFLASAVALREPFYQIESGTRPTGRHTESGYEGAGMLQVLPLDDYKKNFLKTMPESFNPRILFVHFNMFKLNIRLLFSERAKDSFTSDEKRVRYCGKPSDNVGVFQFQDIELYMWQEVLWTACEMPKLGINFNDWKYLNMTEICTKTTDHVKWLEKTHNT